MSVAVIDYTDARQILADAQARRALFYPPAAARVTLPPLPRPEPVAPVAPIVATVADRPRARIWSADEIETMRSMAAKGMTSADVAEVVGRSHVAVECKAHELDIKISRVKTQRAPREPSAAPKTRQAMDWRRAAEVEAGRRIRIISKTIDLVSQYALVSRLDIESHRRFALAARARQIVFWLLRTCTTHSFPVIGRAIGDRDHTTVLHGWRKISGLVEQGGQFADDIFRMQGIVSSWWEANRAMEEEAREAMRAKDES